MRRALKCLWASACIAGSLSVAVAAPRASVETLRLDADGSATTLVISLNADSAYRVFTLDSPKRVVIDLVTARLGRGALPLPAGAGAVRQMRAANRADGSVRLVLDVAAAHAEPHIAMLQPPGATARQLVVELPRIPAAPVAVAVVDSVAPLVAPAPVVAALFPPAPVSSAAPNGAATRGLSAGPTQAAAPMPAPAAVAAAPAPAPASAPVVVAPPASAAPKSPAKVTAKSTAQPAAASGRDIVIAVDAGHGGKDPGAHGPRGVREKDVTLRMARRLVEIIDAEPGMRGVLTRKGDEFVPLRTRMERARAAQADLFVSIHADAVRNRTVRGASVYVLNEKGATDEASRRLAARENAADLIGGVSLRSKDRMLASVLLDLSQSASLSSSVEVADHILGEMARVGTVRKPQVMQAPFMVLKSPDVPSVLVETAYISNPEEEQRLDNQQYRSRLAGAIFSGVRSYFYKNPPSGTLVAELSRRQLVGANDVEHVIRQGDTLSELASRYNTSIRLIRDANRLGTDEVSVGQIIRIPAARAT